MASRGLTGKQLIDCQLWWQSWLPDNEKWPNHINIILGSLPEELSSSIVVGTTIAGDDLLLKYSDLEQFLKTTSYILRFTYNCAAKTDVRRRGSINVEERRSALVV